MKQLVHFIWLILLSQQAFSQTITWTGATDTDWATGTNWSTNVAPTNTTKVNIPGSLARYPVLNTNASIQNLVVEAGATLTVNASKELTINGSGNDVVLTVNGTVENNGTITVNQVTSTTADAIQLGGNGQFTNNAGATLTGATIGFYGIRVLGSAVLLNQVGGTLNFAGFSGSMFLSGSTSPEMVQNHGKMTLGGQIEKYAGLFHNYPCGVVKLLAGEVYNNGGQILNEGFFSAASNLNGNGTTSDFINNGIVYVGGTANYTNNAIRIFNNATTTSIFEFAAGNNLTVEGIYKDEAASASAGGFNQGTNTFTHFGLSAGSQTLYANITRSGGTCPQIVPFTFEVATASTFTTQPTSQTVCAGSSASFTVAIANATGYQWQIDAGSGWTNLAATSPYTNVNTATLNISNATGLNGYQYRCVATGPGGATLTSNAATLTIGTGGGSTPTGTLTWTGSVNTDWNTACNWSPNSVPTATNDVVIPNTTNKPTINTAAVAQSVEVQAGAVLTIASTHSLTVNNSFDFGSGPVSFLNLGTVQNNGRLVVDNSTFIIGQGIVNKALFYNNSNAEISINKTIGIFLENAGGTFTNVSKITIDAAGSVGGDIGFKNSQDGVFNNNEGGEIVIFGGPGTAFFNTMGSTFSNKAKITIIANGSGGTALSNEGSLTNTGGGEMSIPATVAQGLVNAVSGIFNNAGKITVGANETGLFNNGTFNNNVGGDIQVERGGQVGLNNLGIFTNSAKITISATVTGDGLRNSGTFNNNACATLLSFGRTYVNVVGATSTNAGLVQLANSLENSGTFTNNGVLKYGSLTGTVTNATDPSLIVKNTPTPIFTYGGTYDGVVNGIFTDAAATLPAGTFTAPNTFEPSGLPAGVQTLYAKITPQGGGCVYVVPFTYEACVPVATPTGTLTWTGSVNTDWNTACNWSPNRVPTATNDVVIPNTTNQPTINTAAVAQSVEVQAGAVLTIAATKSLTINGSRTVATFDAGFHNAGTVQNNGQLVLGSTSSVGAYGLFNRAIFNNNTDGEIKIDQSTDTGLLNDIGGTFTNAAKITIGAVASVGPRGILNQAIFNNNAGGEISIDNSTADGLRNLGGTFTNVAKITLGATASVGSTGIFNYAVFNNNAGGEIKIDNATGQGVENEGGTFTNTAKITIGLTRSAGQYGIYNRSNGTFNNYTGGEIKIDNSTISGLYNHGGSFTNADKITIGATGSIGSYSIFNNASFTNNSGGTITLDNASVSALSASVGSTLTNAATILIGATVSIGSGSYGLANDGTINNTACGKLIVASGILQNNASRTITNAGLVQLANSLENNGTFTNNGVLKYGSLTGTVTNATNASLIVKNTPTPIFTYGGTYDGVVNGIFTDAAATLPAGTFTAPNTFEPSGLPGGSQTLYAKITPQGGGCVYVVPFTFVIAQGDYTWTGAVSKDWNTPGNWLVGGSVPTVAPTFGSQTGNRTLIPVVANGNYPEVTATSGARSVAIAANARLTITNTGNLQIVGSDTDGVTSAGTFTNNGTVLIDSSYNDGFVNQTGASLINTNTFTVRMGTGNRLENYGSVNNSGTFTVGGGLATAILNHPAATLTNTSTFAVSGGLTGGMLNQGTIDNSGQFTVSGGVSGTLFINQETVTNRSGATMTINIHTSLLFDNQKLVENEGTLNIRGGKERAVINREGATIRNKAGGTLNVSGGLFTLFRNGGLLENYHVVSFSANSDTCFYNLPTGEVKNEASFSLNGISKDAMLNLGKFTHGSAGILNINRVAGYAFKNGGTFLSSAGCVINTESMGSFLLNLSNAVFENKCATTYSRGGVAILNQGRYTHTAGSFTVGQTGDVLQNSDYAEINVPFTSTGNMGMFFLNSDTLILGPQVVVTTSPPSRHGTPLKNTGAGYVHSQADFTISSATTLIDNAGKMVLGGQSTLIGTNMGTPIVNTGNLTNEGTANFNRFGGYGINNSGTFINKGRFETGNSDKSLYNNGGTIENSGVIEIDSVFRDAVLQEGSGSSFTNTATGQINVDFVFGNGIKNTAGSFVNNGEIMIAQTDTIGLSGINNAGTFQNNKLMRIGGVGKIRQHGLYNTGTFVNSTNSQVFLQSAEGSGVTNEGGSITNQNCGSVLVASGILKNYSTGNVTNAGLVQVTDNVTNEGTFTNNGVLKYGSLTGTVTNATDPSLIVNNTPTPIFTYGGTYNGVVNGIYTDAAATLPAGTFTAPNAFEPSGLPAGVQTLYAKITPQGGACSYVVPFTFNNTALAPVFTTQPTAITRCSGSSASFTAAATNATAYQWQFNSGGGWSNVPASAPYANGTTTTLTISNVAGLNGYQFRCVAIGATVNTNSDPATLTVISKPTITLTTLQQTLNEGNAQTFCDTDANPVNGLQFNVSGSCVVGNPVWRVQVGSGAWSNWSATAPVSQPSNNQPHRYQAACEASCPSTYTSPIELTINYRASVPQNVSLLVDGVTVAVGETKEVCSLVNTNLTFNANCAAGETLLYSVDGGEYSTGVPVGLVDNQFHNYRVRCRKSDGTPSCVESESGVMRLKLVVIPAAPTVSLSSTSSCNPSASFSGQSTCGSLRTVWYNASTNVALPSLPATVPSQTTSYYARCQTENGCVSEKSNVVTFTLTPTQVAPVITASQEIVCTGTTVRISANCPAGSQTFWNTGVTTPSFEVAFNNVTKQTYWAKCLFEGGCQSSESVRKDVYWNAFVVTLINIGESKSAVKPANDKSLWTSQFITRDGGPELEQSTQVNPTLFYVENANKMAPRYWTINVEACGLSTDGSLTFDMLATPEMGVIRSFNTHENNAPYFMYANREGWTELYGQNHPAYGFYQDNGAGGNVYDAGLPKGLYKLGIRYWDQKGWGSIYPSTRKPQGNVLAYQEYWFRIQSRDGVGVGAARTAEQVASGQMANGQGARGEGQEARGKGSDNGQPITDNGVFATVMPNPVSNILRLKVQESKGQVVQTALTDASGREVLRRQFVPETNTHQEEFGVGELPNGVYFLKVNSGNQQVNLKVVKLN